MTKFGKPVKAKKNELSAKTMTVGQSYSGVLQGQKEFKGFTGYSLIDLDEEDNETGGMTFLWGTSDLNEQMKSAEEGDKVTVTYRGKTNVAKGYKHLFDVEIQKPMS